MKRALVVGINEYPGSPLRTCVDDARAMAALLEHHADGSRNYDVRLMTSDSEPIDRPRLRTLIAQLFENARDAELLFYFSGHGADSPWGAELVTQDVRPNSLGVSMNDVMTLANATPAQEVVIILDCCFSGDLGNSPGLQDAAVAPAFRMSRAVMGEGVTLLAASRATQVATELPGHSAFTSLLLAGLAGAAADQLGNVTALSLYDCASRAFGSWDQRPVFKSHVTQPSILRLCNPSVDCTLLRKLPAHFPRATTRLRLTPAHEGVRPIPPGSQPTHEQESFDYFKHLRNAGLLATDQNKDLYFIALDSNEVFLTTIGQYFWRLAFEKRL